MFGSLALTSIIGLGCLGAAQASVTVYGQIPLAQASAASSVSGTASGASTAAAASYTGSAAYDPTMLVAPDPPSPAPAMQFTIELQSATASVQGLSIPQAGTFYGFSVEFSVINQVFGVNSSFLQVPFLNLMSNIQKRAGAVHVRAGGNTQETATLVDSIPNNKIIAKQGIDPNNPTATPGLIFTTEAIYMLGNISSLVNVKWYLGVPFNDTTNLRLAIAEVGENILGDNLLGLQVGNEPDLYAAHQHRASTYGPFDYFGEFGVAIDAMKADSSIPVVNNLIGPSVSGTWTPEEVWATNFIPTYTDSLGFLSVEHYPHDNCAAIYPTAGNTPIVPQDIFVDYLDHSGSTGIVAPYVNSANIAQAANKPFLMFETNSASCGGFPGVSNSFGAALWALDYGLQMAASNFSGALLHVGGQNVYYNPFTPPPTNQSSFHQWTIGPVYYSALVVAEAFGKTNTSRIIDLFPNNGSVYTPAYAIYEGDNLARVAMFNYITDASGANDYTATISVQGGSVPAQIKVKRLSAPSVSELTNITWAGQTFGGSFATDGRPTGDVQIDTITCDQTANTCPVTVHAPEFVMVFLSTSDPAITDDTTNIQTFSTTALTKTANTATVDPTVLATSNGHSGLGEKLGSTSKGSAKSGAMGWVIPNAVVLLAMTIGGLIVRRGMLTY